MNKKLSIVLIVLLSVLLAFVVGIMIFLFRSGANNINFSLGSFNIASGTSTKLVDSKEFTEMKKIDVDFNVADVDVITSETDSIKVELYADDPEEYSITESLDSIKVVLKDKETNGVRFLFGRKINKIKVYVPMNYASSFAINGVTGDVNIADYSEATAKVTIKTGDIKIKELNMAEIEATTGDIEVGSASLLNIKVTTGDVEVGTVRFLDITGTTGDIDVKEVDRLKVKVTTGDIDIYKVNEYLTLEATTGDIDIDTVTIKENSNIKVTTGDIKVKHANGFYVSGTSKIGDTHIKGVDRKSDIVLNIEAKVGDIKVN
ncbi:MAG: DUF4097 family beta strand repeat protein [Bacilli bacterium]|nr:DUF4097 family beta strand repeat protein [Bacilli bacterium]